MAYADLEYYRNTYCGGILPDREAEKYLSLASEDADAVTYCRITGIGFDRLTAFQQERIRRAVCMQAENIYISGDPAAGGDICDMKLGDFSISGKAGGVRGAFSKRGMQVLTQTGLCERSLEGGRLWSE